MKNGNEYGDARGIGNHGVSLSPVRRDGSGGMIESMAEYFIRYIHANGVVHEVTVEATDEGAARNQAEALIEWRLRDGVVDRVVDSEGQVTIRPTAMEPRPADSVPDRPEVGRIRKINELGVATIW